MVNPYDEIVIKRICIKDTILITVKKVKQISPYNFENKARKYLRCTINATTMREDEVNMRKSLSLFIYEKMQVYSSSPM